MNKEKLNNIVILKEIPSNLIDEAIIILKSNNSLNKKKIEDYAKLEGMDTVKNYLKEEKHKRSLKKKKIYFFIAIITFFSLLFLLIKHIH